MQPRLIPNYIQAPGRCFGCKAAQRVDNEGRGELIVDLGVELESPVTADPSSVGFNVQYLTEPLVLCEACITELGGMIGMAPMRDVVKARAVAADAKAALAVHETHVAELHAIIDGLHRAGYGSAVEAERETVKPKVKAGASSASHS